MECYGVDDSPALSHLIQTDTPRIRLQSASFLRALTTVSEFAILGLRKEQIMRYKVPVTWVMGGYVEVDAESKADALAQVEKNAENFGLPEGEYQTDSFYVVDDEEQVEVAHA